jgi:putative transposase
MTTLNENKRKWIIQQYRKGRSATSIAKIQKVSRQYVYDLTEKYKKECDFAYKTKKAGRPRTHINLKFVEKVVEIRKRDDYGSEKIHHVMKRDGFSVSQHIIQRILDEQGLTDPCEKRRGQRSYVRYEWPISNYMWHTDWSELDGKQYLAYIDDRSRRIMAGGEFTNATAENTILILHQAMLINEVSPVLMLSDKGSQFYANIRTKSGEKGISQFEEEVHSLGIDFWTSRRNHPQTNGKMEKWFDTMKKRKKKHPEESFHDFIYWYNDKRIHHALGYKTPNEVYYEKL